MRNENNICYTILVGNSEKKRTLERPRLTWGIILRWKLNKYSAKVFAGFK
jgi:hypothetical protein